MADSVMRLGKILFVFLMLCIGSVWMPWVEIVDWADHHVGATQAIGGLAALVAAAVAYAAAMKQVRAPFEILKETKENERRALALLLWAELVNCRDQIIRCLDAPDEVFRSFYEDPNRTPVLDTRVYDANLSQIGLLDAVTAYMVVGAFQEIRDINRAIIHNIKLQLEAGESCCFNDQAKKNFQCVIERWGQLIKRLADGSVVDEEISAAVNE